MLAACAACWLLSLIEALSSSEAAATVSTLIDASPEAFSATWTRSLVWREAPTSPLLSVTDIFGLANYFQQVTPGRFKLVVLDAFYRFLPRDTDGSVPSSLTFGLRPRDVK